MGCNDHSIFFTLQENRLKSNCVVTTGFNSPTIVSWLQLCYDYYMGIAFLFHDKQILKAEIVILSFYTFFCVLCLLFFFFSLQTISVFCGSVL